MIGHVITPVAESVPYDNTTSGLTAEDTQAAIDEVAASSSGLPSDVLSGSLTVGTNLQLVLVGCYTIESAGTLTLTGTLGIL